MRIKFVVILSLILANAQFLKSDPWIVQADAIFPPGESDLSIVILEQLRKGILAVTIETKNGELLEDPFSSPTINKPSLQEELDFPSIALAFEMRSTEWSALDRIAGPFIYEDGFYFSGLKIVELDLSYFNDWIEIEGFGNLHMHQYPWVYLEHFGWFWVQPGGIYEDLLSYWLFDETYGWLFTTKSHFPRVYAQRYQGWMTLKN